MQKSFGDIGEKFTCVDSAAEWYPKYTKLVGVGAALSAMFGSNILDCASLLNGSNIILLQFGANLLRYLKKILL